MWDVPLPLTCTLRTRLSSRHTAATYLYGHLLPETCRRTPPLLRVCNPAFGLLTTCTLTSFRQRRLQALTGQPYSSSSPSCFFPVPSPPVIKYAARPKKGVKR